MKNSSRNHLYSFYMSLAITALLILATIGAQHYYTIAENCLSRDFRPGFTAQHCNANVSYDYDSVARNWVSALMIGGTLTVASLVATGIIGFKLRRNGQD